MQPKGSIGVECGEALLKHGYKLKFFNTINFSKSMRYNPMAYIHSEKDVLKLVTALMTNTKGEGQGGDPFWDKAACPIGLQPVISSVQRGRDGRSVSAGCPAVQRSVSQHVLVCQLLPDSGW